MLNDVSTLDHQTCEPLVTLSQTKARKKDYVADPIPACNVNSGTLGHLVEGKLSFLQVTCYTVHQEEEEEEVGRSTKNKNSTLEEQQGGCLIKVPPGRGGFDLVPAQGPLSYSQPASQFGGRGFLESHRQLLLHPLGHSFCKQGHVKVCIPRAKSQRGARVDGMGGGARGCGGRPPTSNRECH